VKPGQARQSVSSVQVRVYVYMSGFERQSFATELVQTEFGRGVARNASTGADNGTGGLAYVLGGGVNGGQVLGWPGLAAADLETGEVLKITTDLRTALLELLGKRLGGTDAGVVFPGFSGAASANMFLS
jgi:uncharacterized protein (DUF1501 family)